MTDANESRTAVFVTLAAALLALSLALAVGPGAVAGDGVTVSCAAGDGGGPVYNTTSGLEVEDNDTAEVEPFGAFPDDETAHFGNDSYANVSFSAAGASEVRLEERSSDRTCLAAVDATTHDVTIAPEDERDVTVAGAVDALAFQAVDLDVDDAVDIATDATAVYTLTVHDTGLEEGDTVVLESVDDGDVDRQADVAADGSVTFEIPDGAHELAMFEHEEAAPPPPPPPPDDDPAFEFDDLEAPDTVEEGATFTATVTVENVGDGEGSMDVVATFADQEVTEADVELQAGVDESLEFAFDADLDPDTYDLVMEETHGGDTVETTVTVEAVEEDDPPVADDDDDADDEPPTADDDGADDEDDADDEPTVADDVDEDDFPLPGFGPLLALLAVVGSAVALGRRTSR